MRGRLGGRSRRRSSASSRLRSPVVETEVTVIALICISNRSGVNFDANVLETSLLEYLRAVAVAEPDVENTSARREQLRREGIGETMVEAHYLLTHALSRF